MESNFKCMSCGHDFHIAPKNEQKAEWRRCPACGSNDTKADHEK